MGSPSSEKSPWPAFWRWWREAHETPSIRYPHAFTLATLGGDGVPDARVVLAHRIDEARGLLFSTDERSAKAEQLRACPEAAAVFHWSALDLQVRVRGTVVEAPSSEADFCFEERPRKSRLTPWASPQSAPLADVSELETAWREAEGRFQGRDVHRPDSWRAFFLKPRTFELWRAGAKRLHERRLWRHGPNGWHLVRLWP